MEMNDLNTETRRNYTSQ